MLSVWSKTCVLRSLEHKKKNRSNEVITDYICSLRNSTQEKVQRIECIDIAQTAGCCEISSKARYWIARFESPALSGAPESTNMGFPEPEDM